MSAQFVLFFALYLVGVQFGLLFQRHVPVSFISISGFLWGSLLWVIVAIATLILATYSLPLMIAGLGGILLVSVLINLWQRTYFQMSRWDWLWLIGMTIIFAVMIYFIRRFNLATATPDSIAQINFGRTLVGQNFLTTQTERLTLWGVFLYILQGASGFVRADYFYELQPIWTVSFGLVFAWLVYAILQKLAVPFVARVVFIIVGFALLFTPYLMIFHSFYIHNNFPSALYLLTAVGAFWMALKEEKIGWYGLGVVALVGFTLFRSEAPLYAVLFLALTLCFVQRLPAMRFWILGYVALISLWYLYQLIITGEGSYILNPERILMMIGGLALFGVLVLLTFIPFIARRIMPSLHWIILLGAIVAVAGMFIVNTDGMLESFTNLSWSLTNEYWWGIMWLVLIGMLILSDLRQHFFAERLFAVGIPVFIVIILALSFFRSPYRIGLGDSGNRMAVEIYPLLVLYVIIRLGVLFQHVTSTSENSEVAPLPPAIPQEPLVATALNTDDTTEFQRTN